MQKKYAMLAVFSILMLNPMSASAAGKNGVAAEVNGQKVMVSELKQAYEMNPAAQQQLSFEDFYNKFIDVYVNGVMLYQAAERTLKRSGRVPYPHKW